MASPAKQKKEAETETTKKSVSPFIQKDNVASAFDETRTYHRRYTDPFDEFERLARNRPSDSISPELPKITDGTLAAIIQEQPKRIVQQIPTGLITCRDYSEYADAANYVLTEKLIPMSNRMGTELQKSWNMIGKAMTYGLSASYTFFTQTGDEMHTDWVIPYIKDVFMEKGKVYAPDSNILFMRSWYQKRDIKAIIDREKRFMEQDKSYKPDWDLKLLSELMDSGNTSKTTDQQTPAEREKGQDTGGIEVIHAFQRGVNAEFYSFSPRFESGKVLRTKINNDPRGNMPIDFMYCNIDLSNPYGRGQVELSGGVQNLIDQQMQMFQFMTTMEMGPPLKVWGTVNRPSLKLRPNAIWYMGANKQNSDVEPYSPQNYALQNYTGNAQFLQSKIFALNSAQDHSISAENNTAGQSKTQAGVKAGEAKLGVSDNYLRKQYETWKGNQWETSLNIFFNEMKGSGSLKVPKDKMKDLLKSDAKKYLKKDKLEIPYKDINDEVFRFKVDASSSEIKEDNDNVEKLTEVYKLLQSDPNPALEDKRMKMLKIIVNEIGAEGTDELFPEEDKLGPDGQPIQAQAQPPQGPDPQMIMQMVQQAMQQAEQAKAQQPKSIAESLNIKFSDLPEDSKQELLKSIGLPTQMETPQHIDQTIKAHDSISKGLQADQSHQFQVDKHAVDTLQQAHAGDLQDAQAQQDPTEAPQPDHSANPLDDHEQQVVEALLHQGFTDQDAEQAIVMARQGMPNDQIMQTLRSKRGQ